MIRLLWIGLCLWLLQGCSAIKLGYQQLPTLGYWWLDSALSLDETQAPAAKAALQKLQIWHRQQELAGYADWLAQSAQLSAGPVTPTQVCAQWTEVQAGMDRLMRQTVAMAAPVALHLGPRQLNHLARDFEDKNDTWDKEWLKGSVDERLARRLDKMLTRYGDFYGELQPAQKDLLREHMATSSWTPEWGRQERQRRQQDLLSALQRISQSNMTPAQAESLLLGVWQRWLQPPEAAGRAVMQTMSEKMCSNLAQLHNSASPEQRQRATRRIKAYERDLRDLVLP